MKFHDLYYLDRGKFGKIIKTNNRVAKKFCLKYHYIKRFPIIKYSYALIRSDELVGIVCYGVPANRNTHKSVFGDENGSVLELSRIALKYNEHNEASWFISRTLSNIPFEGVIITYADARFDHHGGIYQALGFHFSGVTREREGEFPKIHPRHSYVPGTAQSKKYRYWISCPRNKYDNICKWENYLILNLIYEDL